MIYQKLMIISYFSKNIDLESLIIHSGCFAVIVTTLASDCVVQNSLSISWYFISNISADLLLNCH